MRIRTNLTPEELELVAKGLLKLAHRLASEEVNKAVDTGSLSATIKPKGGNSYNKPKAPKPGNVPGLAAKPSAGGVGGEDATQPLTAKEDPNRGKENLEYWGSSRTGQPDPQQGWYQNENGTWVREAGTKGPAKSEDPEARTPRSEEEFLANKAKNDNWSKEGHTRSETAQHLANSEITYTEPLGSKSAPGINDSVKAYTADNGPGILKGSANGGLDCRHEEDACNLFNFAGSDRCAPTVSRVVDGKDKSFQAWNDEGVSVSKFYKELIGFNKDTDAPVEPQDVIKYMLENSSNKDQLVAQLTDIAVLDLVMCNTDRHLNNLMANDDFSEVWAIDHGYSFGTGMQNTNNLFATGLVRRGHKLKVSEDRASWLRNVTYEDIRRTASSTDEWRQAQTYLRIKYVSQAVDNSSLELDWDLLTVEHGFNRFVVDYLDTHSTNPESPEYVNATHFKNLGVLMDPKDNGWGRRSGDADRAQGKQYEYEKHARLKVWFNDTGKKNKELNSKMRKIQRNLDSEITEKYVPKINAVAEKRIDIEDELKSVNKEFASLSIELTDMQKRGMKGDKTVDHEEFRAKLSSLKDVEGRKKQLNSDLDKYKREGKKLAEDMWAEKNSSADQAMLAVAPDAVKKELSMLDEKINTIRSGAIPTKPKAKPDYNKLRPASKRRNTAASDIEARKRDLEGLGWRNRVRDNG